MCYHSHVKLNGDECIVSSRWPLQLHGISAFCSPVFIFSLFHKHQQILSQDSVLIIICSKRCATKAMEGKWMGGRAFDSRHSEDAQLGIHRMWDAASHFLQRPLPQQAYCTVQVRCCLIHRERWSWLCNTVKLPSDWVSKADNWAIPPAPYATECSVFLSDVKN